MVLGAPLGDTYLEPQQNKESLVRFITQAPTIHQKMANLRNGLGTNEYIDGDRLNHKNCTLATTFHKPAGEVNLYV